MDRQLQEPEDQGQRQRHEEVGPPLGADLMLELAARLDRVADGKSHVAGDPSLPSATNNPSATIGVGIEVELRGFELRRAAHALGHAVPDTMSGNSGSYPQPKSRRIHRRG